MDDGADVGVGVGAVHRRCGQSRPVFFLPFVYTEDDIGTC
jgi:hypothetical protein